MRYAKTLILVLLLLAPLAAVTRAPAMQARAADNPVVTENRLAGTTAWQLSGLAVSDAIGQIKGYASATSVVQNQSIDLRISVNPAQTYTMDFYRIGWYGGLGGRLLLHVGPLAGTPQPTCPTDATTGLIACNWATAYTVTPTTAWTSGIYLVALTNAQGYQSYVTFVVKDGRPATYLFQQSVATYQAYNNYPDDGLTGKSLYTFNSYGANTVYGEKRAVKVSFDRPYRAYGPQDFFTWDINVLRWLEKSGYDVTYSTDLDTHANGAALLNSKGFISASHNEYWSKEMFDAVQAARDAGVSLAFLSANGIYRQVRFEPSGAGAPNRVVVFYKNGSLDPVQGSTTSVEFRVPPVNRPEQGLMGVMYCGVPAADCGVNSNVDYVVTDSSNWAYTGTGLRNGDKIPGVVGYEMDRYWPGSPLPSFTSRTLLSQSPFTSWDGSATYANSSIYQAPSGAWVFAAGTASWSWGLDNYWYTVADARIQQITANVLNAFVNGAPVVHHLLVTAPTTVTAGQTFTMSVTAVNSKGSTAPYLGTVHFTSSDSQAVLPADYTFTTTDGGVHQFAMTLKTVGSQSVNATDAGNSLITGSQSLTVNSAAASALRLTGLTSTTAGVAQTATVTALDAGGAVSTGYQGTVHFASSDAQAVLPADYTFISGDAGVHQFAVTLKTAGSQSITVTDGGATPGTQTVTISAGPLDHLTLTPSAASLVAGGSQSYAAAGFDQFGNGLGDMTASTTFTIAPNGSCAGATCTATVAGAHTVTGANAGKSGTASLSITPGPLTQLTLSPSSATIAAGGGLGYTAIGSDQYGNSLGDVTASTTFTIAPNGSCTGATCGATLAGAHTVTGSNAGSAATASLTVIPAAASQLILSTPASAKANTAFTTTVTLRDAYGNLATGYSGTVHFSTSDLVAQTLGGMPADYTFTAGDAGFHTFSVTLVTVGGQTITVTDTANAALGATSPPITVTLL